MNDGFAWWLVVLGIVVGVALVWLVMVRLPREESDIDESEREAEAAWISRTINAYGGLAPEPLVEEVLELHQHYLASTGVAAIPTGEAEALDDPAADDDGPGDGAASAEPPAEEVSRVSDGARLERPSVGPAAPGTQAGT